MEYKKIIKKLLFISAVTFIIGYVFLNPLQFGICRSTYDYGSGCLAKTDELVGEPLILFSLVTALSLSILFFLREEIFTAWWRFTKWFLLVAVMLIAVSPEYGNGIGDITPTREIAVWFLAGLFFIISLGIIIMKSITLRRK